MSEEALRAQICLVGRLMHERQYVDGASGNISARLTPHSILATPSGLSKGFLTPEQLIEVNMEGERVDAATAENAHLRPTSEMMMHLECYRQRPDIGGVVHAHPPTAVALTIAGYDFQRCILPEAIITLGLVPTAPYATPASAENRALIGELIREHDAVLLAHHGSLTVGQGVWDAYLRLETLEHSANILYRAAQMGGARPLTNVQVEQLLAIRRKLGYMHTGDEERFRRVLEQSAGQACT